MNEYLHAWNEWRRLVRQNAPAVERIWAYAKYEIARAQYWAKVKL